jgi:trimethylamine--corrinoid protein Co-methyltransferase
MQTLRPCLKLLSDADVTRIVEQALSVLEHVGVYIENREAMELVASSGGRALEHGRVAIPGDLARRALGTAPRSVSVYSRDGLSCVKLDGMAVNFDPGSAAINILDSETRDIRPPVTRDLVRFARLTDALEYIDAQSTGLVPSDVPRSIADRYRLYIALKHCRKPIVTGTFAVEGFAPMRDMLAAVAGGEEELRKRPTAIFDACPSPPLKWSNLTAQTLLDCARSGLPAELVAMPLLGATAPAAIAGGLVQHTAESISGIVIHQLACPGSPIIYGGSPAVFDMRTGTTPMGAIETMMLDCAYVQIGRSLGLPTHAYMALSDAKTLDAQAGLETGIGAVLAALAGVNMVSGPGMLDFESCQSLEKLVIDNEICGMVKRLIQGIAVEEPLASELYADLSAGDLFLTSPDTLARIRSEFFYPSAVIDRRERDLWRADGRKTAFEAARERVEHLLMCQPPAALPEDVGRELDRIMLAEARRHGLDRLPGQAVSNEGSWPGA